MGSIACKPNGRRSADLNWDRRRESRVGSQFGLMFTGVDGRRFVMDDGEVLDLSDEGIGIRANRTMKHGMELALFIQLPDSDDPLCIAEAQVSWVNGYRVGVTLRTLKLEDQNRLRFSYGIVMRSSVPGGMLPEEGRS